MLLLPYAPAGLDGSSTCTIGKDLTAAKIGLRLPGPLVPVSGKGRTRSSRHEYSRCDREWQPIRPARRTLHIEQTRRHGDSLLEREKPCNQKYCSTANSP